MGGPDRLAVRRWVHDVAMAWLVLTLTGSPLTLGTVLVTGTVPRTASMVLGGALTDRFSARTMLIATNATRALLALVLAGLVLTSTLRLWELYSIEFFFGAADGLFLPAISAVVPDTVPDSDLVAANGMIGASEEATMIGGPAVGGVLVASLATWGAFAFNGATFVAAALGAAPIESKPRARSAPRAVRTLVGEGIALIRSDREMRTVFLLGCAAAASGGAVFVVGLPTLARTRFGMGAVGLGLIFAAWGIGQLVGALGAGRIGLPSRWGWLLIVTALMDACVYLIFGVTSSVWLVIALLVPLGILVAYASDVARPVWIQRHSPPAIIGRAFGLLELPYYSIAPLSMLVFGAIASRSLSIAFIAVSVFSLLVAAASLASRTVRRLVIPSGLQI